MSDDNDYVSSEWQQFAPQLKQAEQERRQWDIEFKRELESDYSQPRMIFSTPDTSHPVQNVTFHLHKDGADVASRTYRPEMVITLRRGIEGKTAGAFSDLDTKITDALRSAKIIPESARPVIRQGQGTLQISVPTYDLEHVIAALSEFHMPKEEAILSKRDLARITQYYLPKTPGEKSDEHVMYGANGSIVVSMRQEREAMGRTGRDYESGGKYDYDAPVQTSNYSSKPTHSAPRKEERKAEPTNGDASKARVVPPPTLPGMPRGANDILQQGRRVGPPGFHVGPPTLPGMKR